MANIVDAILALDADAEKENAIRAIALRRILYIYYTPKKLHVSMKYHNFII